MRTLWQMRMQEMSKVEELRQEQIQRVRRKKRRRLWWLLLLLLPLLLAVVVIIASIQNRDFGTTFYRVTSDKIQTQMRAVLLTDLHNHEYGEKNEDLIRKIVLLDPDIILMAGDMVNYQEEDTRVIERLCKELLETAPVYFCLGNHEGTLIYVEEIPLDVRLAELGVKVFYDDYCETAVNGNLLAIGGTASSGDNSYETYGKAFIDEFEETDRYKILLDHYPTMYYEILADKDIDLCVAGHFHGGIVRLPGVGGLYHPDSGFFPQYDGGQYRLPGGADLIVSRGLGGHGIIPRINNRPELVVIDISHK